MSSRILIALVRKRRALLVLGITLAAIGLPNMTHACNKDTDCKGDRVCSAGQCSDPNPLRRTAASLDAPHRMLSITGDRGLPVYRLGENVRASSMAVTSSGALALGVSSAQAEALLCKTPCELDMGDLTAVTLRAGDLADDKPFIVDLRHHDHLIAHERSEAKLIGGTLLLTAGVLAAIVSPLAFLEDEPGVGVLTGLGGLAGTIGGYYMMATWGARLEPAGARHAGHP